MFFVHITKFRLIDSLPTSISQQTHKLAETLFTFDFPVHVNTRFFVLACQLSH